MQPAALFLFEHSTRTAGPWAAAGYLCYCVDIDHPAGESREGNIIRIGHDLLNWQPPADVVFSFAAAMPPCTDLTKSGARWWKEKGLHRLADAIKLVAVAADLCESLNCPYYIENPNGALSTHWRKPDYDFDPCEYAGYLPAAERIEEAYTKRTNLWTGGGFVMPEKKEVVPLLGSKMHLLAPGPNRARLRSESPRGFALAVTLTNSSLTHA